MPVTHRFERFIITEQFRLIADHIGVPVTDLEKVAAVNRIVANLADCFPTIGRDLIVDVVAALTQPAPVTA